jgi:hypothetical protein
MGWSQEEGKEEEAMGLPEVIPVLCHFSPASHSVMLTH